MDFVKRATLARAGYAVLFVAVVPSLLVWWAHATSTLVRAPALHLPLTGVFTITVGLTLMISGMLSLWRVGGGLPMNAFPPPNLVTSGVYALMPHPIYVGFVLVCLGVSLAAGSASGLWLITPITGLACTALVLGYEAPDLNRRFPGHLRPSILPADSDNRPSSVAILRTYLIVLLPWLIIYELIVFMGVPQDALETKLPFEYHIPVWQWTEAFYFSTYVVVILTPLLLRTSRDLRKFFRRGLLAMAFVFPLYWLIPLICVPGNFPPTNFWGHLLTFERQADFPGAAFPSFHVIWALIAASALSTTTRRRIVWGTWAALVIASCITTTSHSFADVFAGMVAFTFIARADRIWLRMLATTEAVANSWEEWRFGPLRVINHGIFGAVGVFLGLFVTGLLLGPGADLVVISIFLGASIGAALWAQWIEGSPTLLRPLGFYGGVLGGCAGLLIAPALNVSIWTAFCALAIAAPIIQGLGRLRCLVQGCCHGRPVNYTKGIRYSHPMSRVCRLTGLKEVELYPTPLYSFLWNIVILLVLVRLLAIGTTTGMICGVYLLLGGMGRFVEEAYRGEPQTASVFGLRLYQWMGIASVVVGVAFTAITDAPSAPVPQWYPMSLVTAAGCGVLAWFVCAIDFPGSDRRFSRLT